MSSGVSLCESTRNVCKTVDTHASHGAYSLISSMGNLIERVKTVATAVLKKSWYEIYSGTSKRVKVLFFSSLAGAFWLGQRIPIEATNPIIYPFYAAVVIASGMFSFYVYRSIDFDYVCSPHALKWKPTLTNLICAEHNQIRTERGACKTLALPTPSIKPNGRNAVDIIREITKDIAFHMGYGEASTAVEKQNICQQVYKQSVGLFDAIDDSFQTQLSVHRGDKGTPLESPSTFSLRQAVLQASQKDGVPLESWQAFTKSGRPRNSIWDFVEKQENWIPEVQEEIDGWMKMYTVRAKKLSAFIREKNIQAKKAEATVELIKGIFGAGKTALATKMYPQNVSGIISSDRAKAEVHRSMPAITHNQIHVQGSQIAFTICQKLLQEKGESVVYESALSHPEDIREFLTKAETVHKQVIIYDIVRQDMACVLSVLQRNFGGEDPLIPPKKILATLLESKLRRAECMNAVLQSTITDPKLRPEYHFLRRPSYHLFGSYNKDRSLEKIVTLYGGSALEWPKSTPTICKQYFGEQGLAIENGTNQVRSTLVEKDVQAQFNQEFNKTVHQVLMGMSSTIQAELRPVFVNRIIELYPPSKKPIQTPEELHNAFSGTVQLKIPKNAVIKAFSHCTKEACNDFFTSIEGKSTISYMDFPLFVALEIHSQLLEDLWS